MKKTLFQHWRMLSVFALTMITIFVVGYAFQVSSCSPGCTEDDLNADHISLESDIGTIDGKVDTIDTNVTTIDGKVDTIDSNITTIDTNVTTIDGKVDTIDTNVTTIDGKVDTIDTNVITIDGKIGAATSGPSGTDLFSDHNDLQLSINNISSSFGASGSGPSGADLFSDHTLLDEKLGAFSSLSGVSVFEDLLLIANRIGEPVQFGQNSLFADHEALNEKLDQILSDLAKIKEALGIVDEEEDS